MRQGTTRRAVAVASATAMAGAALVVGGAGVASAAPVVWEDGGSKFTRSVSNETPNAGDVITVTTKFERTNGFDEYVYYIEDHHDACLTYVADSARRNGSENIEHYVRQDSPSAVIVDRKSPGWRVSDLAGSRQSQTVSLQYEVSQDCARATPLNTGLVYSGTLGEGRYPTKGPAVTVSKNNSQTTFAPVSGAMVGTATTLSATVSGAAPGDPVEFYSGTTKLGEGAVGANGIATYSWIPSVRGSVALQAKFPVSDRANSSESTVQNVSVAQKNATSVTTLPEVSGAEVGTGTLLTASVSPAGAGGTVTFTEGGRALATVAVGGNSQASYMWTPQTAGERKIVAEFSGREGVDSSSATRLVQVAERPAEAVASTTTLDPVASFAAGATSTLVARVSPADVGGSVTFKDGDIVLGTITVGADGTARFEWTPDQPGQRTVTAEYSGSGNVQSSTDAVSVVVRAVEEPGPTDPTDPASGSLGSISDSLGGGAGGVGSLSSLGG